MNASIDRISPDSPEHAGRHSVKSHVLDYWTERADDFSELHQREFASPKHDAWLAEIVPFLPKGERLRVLDLGCGSGFVALVMAELGHAVTGLDLVPEMISEARHNAAKLGLPATFMVGDAEDTGLAPASFDVIVTRNLTWTLPHLDVAYRHWHDLLAPGGVLINLDGDYCHEAPLPDLELPAEHAHKSMRAYLVREYEHIKEHLADTQKARPAWDLALLDEAGFADVQLDEGVSGRLYAEVDAFYNPTPMFRIVARA